MAKSVEALTSDYETALAAHHDDPDDARKRTAADRASERLNEARQQVRQGRSGVGVVTTDNTPED